MAASKNLGETVGAKLRASSLERQCRAAEVDKKAFEAESQDQVRRYLSTIDILTNETSKAREELQALRVIRSSTQFAVAEAKLEQLREDNAKLKRQIEAEQKRKDDVQAKVSLLDDRVKKCREKMGAFGGVNAVKDSRETMEKHIGILENRLHKELQKYNEAVAKTKQLKDEIDGLRREKKAFDDLYKKRDVALQKKRKEMAAYIEVSNAAYEARDLAQRQLLEVKATAQEEYRRFEKIREELAILNGDDREVAEATRKLSRNQPHADQTHEEKEEKRSSSQKSCDRRLTGASERVVHCEEALKQIRTATGMDDPEDLIQNFLKAEEKNFSLFNFSNGLSLEVEQIEDRILHLEEEIERMTHSTTQTTNSPPLSSRIDAELGAKHNMIELYEQKLKSCRATRSTILAGINAMCVAIWKEPPGGPEVKSWLEIGTEASIFQALERDILRSIENYTDTHLSQEVQKIKEAPPAFNAPPELKTQHKTFAIMDGMQIIVPSIFEQFEDEQADGESWYMRPLSREELTARSVKNCNKKNEEKRKNKCKK